MQVPFRETGEPGIRFFLSIQSPLHLHFGHGVGCRPLQRCPNEHGRKSNPAREYRVGQKSMQVHASHPFPAAISRGMKWIAEPTKEAGNLERPIKNAGAEGGI